MIEPLKRSKHTPGHLPEGLGPDTSIPFRVGNTRRIDKDVPLKRPKNIKGVPPAYRDIFDRT